MLTLGLLAYTFNCWEENAAAILIQKGQCLNISQFTLTLQKYNKTYLAEYFPYINQDKSQIRLIIIIRLIHNNQIC